MGNSFTGVSTVEKPPQVSFPTASALGAGMPRETGKRIHGSEVAGVRPDDDDDHDEDDHKVAPQTGRKV